MNIIDMIEKKINKNQNQKKQKDKIVMKITTGAMAGIATGVVLAVLNSGKESRDDIIKTAKILGKNTVIKTAEIKEILDDKVVKAKNNVTTATDKITKYLEDKVEKSDNKKEDEATVVTAENEEIGSMAKTEEQMKYPLNFHNIYSKKIYYYLKSYESRDKNVTICKINSLDELRDKFGCLKTYKRYSDFKRSVLKPACEEINRDSDISFKFEEVKIKNKVTSLKFYIKYN